MRRRSIHVSLIVGAPVFVFAVWGMAAALLAQAQGARIPAGTYSELRWRYIGPEGNRVSAIAGVPGDPQTIYAGSASGGSRRR